MENGGKIEVLEAALKTFCSIADYREGETIYSPCQHDTTAYLVRRGRVKLYHLDESGKRLTLAILGEGSLFGELALAGSEQRESSAKALEDVSCWVIDQNELRKRARTHPDMVLELLKLFLQRMNDVQERLKEMVFKDLETRLARTLLHLVEKHGLKDRHRWEIALKITHQELAELVGGTRENVTMLLNRFESEGLIAKARYHIDITDPLRLAERASLSDEGQISEN